MYPEGLKIRPQACQAGGLLRLYFYSCRVRARSKHEVKQLKSSFLEENELVPSMTKNTSSVFFLCVAHKAIYASVKS